LEIAQPAQGLCDGGESHSRGIDVDEPAVAGDEKTGRAGCDDTEVIDVESIKEQYDMVVAAIGSCGP
jgi:hypothetical protein